MLRALMEIIENMYEQIENVCRQVEILRKKSKRHARDKKKNTDKDMKNAFTHQQMGKIRKVFELENMATETSKTEKQRIERLWEK